MQAISGFAIIAALVAAAATPSLARFQQQNPPVEKQIHGFGSQIGLDGNSSGALADLSGRIPSTLLGASDPCDQARLGDELIDFAMEVQDREGRRELINLVKTYMSAEKNFDPSVGSPSFCTDPALPRRRVIRGVLPLVDPGRQQAKRTNTRTQARLQTCLGAPRTCDSRATDMSIAEQMIEMGYSDFKGSGDV